MQSGRRGNLPYVIARRGCPKLVVIARHEVPWRSPLGQILVHCGDCFASLAMTRGARNDASGENDASGGKIGT